MEYKNFIKLLRTPGNVSPESLPAMQELTREFPYFQPAHLLLAKAMKEQEHLRYEKQLKLASAYAADRRVLYSLIHDHAITLTTDQVRTSGESLSPFTLEENEEPLSHGEMQLSDRDLENPFISTPFIPESTRDTEEEKDPAENTLASAEEGKIEPRYQLEMDEPGLEESSGTMSGLSGTTEATGSDPREVIRKRLAEILGNPDKSTPDTMEKEAGVSEELKREDLGEKIEFHSHTHEDESVRKAIEIKSEESIEKPVAETAVTGRTDSAETHSSANDQLSPDLSVAADELEKMELGVAIEDSILSSIEKLPLIAHEAKDPGEVVKIIDAEGSLPEERSGARTFSRWLSAFSMQGFGTFEEVHAVDPELLPSDSEPAIKGIPEEEARLKTQVSAPAEKEDGKQSRKELIEKFIASEPKIVPSKAEFYSPVTQAKKSVEEHDDLVSETLATIYRQQGNLSRARFCYEKLSLLIPGKSAYFAALIKEIDEELNKFNQEDL